MRRLLVSLITIAGLLGGSFAAVAQNAALANGSAKPGAKNSAILLPMKEGSVRFAIIGDTGTGANPQKQVADTMHEYHSLFPFEFVLMMGDNLYGGEDPKDYDKKFESIYRKLLDDKVKFYATLGNHDNSNQRFYKHFNMDGKEYFGFRKGNAHFWSLNSNYMDPKQVKWLEEELSKSDAKWKICFFHHPPYSSGKQHGSDEQLRKVVEPIFLKHGVDVVFAGHEHFYERLKPQKGIHYFISGAGGKLRPGDVKATSMTAKSYDKDLHFMFVEIVDDALHFQVISRGGATIDSGVLTDQKEKAASAN